MSSGCRHVDEDSMGGRSTSTQGEGGLHIGDMVQTQAFPAEERGLAKWIDRFIFPSLNCCKELWASPRLQGQSFGASSAPGKGAKVKAVLLLYHHFEYGALNMAKSHLKIQCFDFAPGLATRKEPPTFSLFARPCMKYRNTWLSFAYVLQVAVVEVPNTGDGSLRVRLQASFRVPEKANKHDNFNENM